MTACFWNNFALKRLLLWDYAEIIDNTLNEDNSNKKITVKKHLVWASVLNDLSFFFFCSYIIAQNINITSVRNTKTKTEGEK